MNASTSTELEQIDGWWKNVTDELVAELRDAGFMMSNSRSPQLQSSASKSLSSSTATLSTTLLDNIIDGLGFREVLERYENTAAPVKMTPDRQLDSQAFQPTDTSAVALPPETAGNTFLHLSQFR